MANSEMIGARNNSTIEPKIPPITDAIKAILNALEGYPFFARPKPSATVAAFPVVPGVPSRIEVMDPPYVPPL